MIIQENLKFTSVIPLAHDVHHGNYNPSRKAESNMQKGADDKSESKTTTTGHDESNCND